MSEDYSAGAAAALEADIYHEQVFVKIEFPGYTFRVSDMERDYDLDGETYVASGSLGSISAIAESADLTADTVQLSLSGLNPLIAAELRDFAHQGSPVTIIIAQIDEEIDQVIDDPVSYSLVVDTMQMVLGETLTVLVNCEHYIRLLFRGPDGHRRVQADQDAIFGVGVDLGLEFASRLPEEILWGKETTKVPQTAAQSGVRFPNFAGVGYGRH